MIKDSVQPYIIETYTVNDLKLLNDSFVDLPSSTLLIPPHDPSTQISHHFIYTTQENDFKYLTAKSFLVKSLSKYLLNNRFLEDYRYSEGEYVFAVRVLKHIVTPKLLIMAFANIHCVGELITAHSLVITHRLKDNSSEGNGSMMREFQDFLANYFINKINHENT